MNIEVTVRRWGKQGGGVAYSADSRLWIPGVIPGETVICSPVETTRNNTVLCKLVQVIEPADSRIQSRCRQSCFCSGCCYRHVRYTAQEEILVSGLRFALSRAIPHNPDIPITFYPHPTPEAYRLRLNARIIRTKYGLIPGLRALPGWDNVPDLRECPNQTPELNQLLRDVMQWLSRYPELSEKTSSLSIYLSSDGRHRIVLAFPDTHCSAKWVDKKAFAETFPDVSLIAVPASDSIGNKSRFTTPVILGTRQISFFDGKRHLAAGYGSWIPVSRESAPVLISALLKIFHKTGINHAIEIGCGIGTVSFALAEAGIKVIGIDAAPSAIESARINTLRTGITGVEFIHGRPRKVLRRLLARLESTDALIFHGMRKPFQTADIQMVPAVNPGMIILISPGIYGFLQNLKTLLHLGYTCRSIALFDQIPHTASMLSLAVLDRIHPVN